MGNGLPNRPWFQAIWKEERRAYNRLRSVCSTWARTLATAPGLSSGLELDLARWVCNLEDFKERLSPWLAMISQNHPYHLTIELGGEEDLKSDVCTSMVRYLLLEATPTPKSLSIDSFKTSISVMYWGDSAIHSLPLKFPQLKSLITVARTSFETRFSHPTLQSLALLNVIGASEDLARLCMGLPCLQELEISSSDVYALADPLEPLETPLTHSALKILIVGGEDALPFTGAPHSAVPRVLRAAGMGNVGQIRFGGNPSRVLFQDHTFPIFRASSIYNFDLQTSFCCRRRDEEEREDHLISPYATFRNVKEIVCFDLEWLYERIDLTPNKDIIKVYTTMDALEKDGKELRRKGVVLEQCFSRYHGSHPSLVSPSDVPRVEDQRLDLRCLLSIVPPLLLTTDLFVGVFLGLIREQDLPTWTLIFDEELDRADLEEVLFEEAFPFLESLAIDAPIDFSSPICHTNIQALSLSNIYGPPEEFSGWLVDMPQLRELKICSQNLYPPIGMGRFPFVSRIPLIHSAVEVLVLEGEDLMLLLEYLTFPSLKFFSLDAQGSLGEEDEVVSSFFQRSCTGKRDFTASFQGRPSKHTFKLFLQNLPICTRLHYALDGLIVDEEDEDEDGDDYNVENIPSDIPYHAHHIAEIFFSKSLSRSILPSRRSWALARQRTHQVISSNEGFGGRGGRGRVEKSYESGDMPWRSCRRMPLRNCFGRLFLQ
ncbi:hypothetical protein BKA70DRAFT_1567940 [Coprinopsis sp. MPI-PUGE-AT-0042]|nr:hypothetical protein BKA70DRAFT_1567940 [Coprinopsis sp. MPI-PUGE-AT-0042]